MSDKQKAVNDAVRQLAVAVLELQGKAVEAAGLEALDGLMAKDDTGWLLAAASVVGQQISFLDMDGHPFAVRPKELEDKVRKLAADCVYAVADAAFPTSDEMACGAIWMAGCNVGGWKDDAPKPWE